MGNQRAVTDRESEQFVGSVSTGARFGFLGLLLGIAAWLLRTSLRRRSSN